MRVPCVLNTCPASVDVLTWNQRNYNRPSSLVIANWSSIASEQLVLEDGNVLLLNICKCGEQGYIIIHYSNSDVMRVYRACVIWEYRHLRNFLLLTSAALSSTSAVLWKLRSAWPATLTCIKNRTGENQHGRPPDMYSLTCATYSCNMSVRLWLLRLDV